MLRGLERQSIILLLPELRRVLFHILLRGLEKVRRYGPEVGYERRAFLDQRHHALDIVLRYRSGCEIVAYRALVAARDLDTVLFKYRDEQVGKFLVGFHPEVLLIEPFGLVGVELGAGLLHLLHRECLYQLVQREQFAVVAGVPPEHRQHVHERLREIPVLTVPVGRGTVGSHPPQREYRESHLVPVALAELAVADGLQKQ